ncbi:hypothetical protein HDU83_005060 [Entophlyctis luteolus]|nr:hypothetical protein HDU82_008694 [Entophlyctis luteolus]KAJ3354609.1 hypothetical protein HDU83_005060 [Entophlyctis luteolus]KAJ3388020.1 hypothetical protein HDU84_000344 [Entophlyctis sp. JEL0112]
MSSGSSGGQWELLRRQAKQLENEAEAKLAMFAKMSSGGAASADATVIDIGCVPLVPLTCSNSSSAEEASLLSVWSQAESLQSDLEEVLKRLTQTTNKMAEFLDNPLTSNTPTNPSQMHVLQRHREILYDYSREFNRTKATIASAKSHAELLSGSSMSRSGRNDSMSMQDMLLSERGHIENAHGMADAVLE